MSNKPQHFAKMQLLGQSSATQLVKLLLVCHGRHPGGYLIYHWAGFCLSITIFNNQSHSEIKSASHYSGCFFRKLASYLFHLKHSNCTSRILVPNTELHASLNVEHRDSNCNLRYKSASTITTKIHGADASYVVHIKNRKVGGAKG